MSMRARREGLPVPTEAVFESCAECTENTDGLDFERFEDFGATVLSRVERKCETMVSEEKTLFVNMPPVMKVRVKPNQEQVPRGP